MTPVDDNGAFWALYLAYQRAIHKVKSVLIGSVLRAPDLYLGPSCTIRGAKLMKVGRHFYAHSRLWIEAVTRFNGREYSPEILIGNDVSVSDSVHITSIERISIGNNVLIGSGVYISDHNHGVYKGCNHSHPESAPSRRPLGGAGPVYIGDNVWIGNYAVIVGPLTIGSGVVIGAGSIVRHDIPPDTIVAGQPARILKKFSRSTNTWERI